MLIKNSVYEPFILTIPDDVIVFSMFDSKDTFMQKFIMENYINFYGISPPLLHEVVFRFENFMDYESIHGLERCFIPIGMMKKYYFNEDIIIQLLDEGYVIRMPVDRSCIDFYGEGAVGTHHLLIFGADLEERFFICKDFKRHEFIEFTIPFSALMKSTDKYDNPGSREANGLLALRIDRTVSERIEYARVLSEFHKLGQDIYDSYSGYGIGAISLFTQDVRDKEWDSALGYKWYEVSNYMREAAKLMTCRCGILSDIFAEKSMTGVEELEQLVRKLSTDTSILYFKVCKFEMKEVISKTEISKQLAVLADVCKEDFKKVSDCFCDMIGFLM